MLIWARSVTRNWSDILTKIAYEVYVNVRDVRTYVLAIIDLNRLAPDFIELSMSVVVKYLSVII